MIPLESPNSKLRGVPQRLQTLRITAGVAAYRIGLGLQPFKLVFFKNHPAKKRRPAPFSTDFAMTDRAPELLSDDPIPDFAAKTTGFLDFRLSHANPPRGNGPW